MKVNKISRIRSLLN